MSNISLNNPKLKPQGEVTNCPNCGAVLLSEVCQYCGSYVGLVATGDLSAEYPTVSCKHGKYTFFGIIFPMIFVVVFGGIGILPILLFANGDSDANIIILMALPFLVIGIGFLLVLLFNIWKIVANQLFGKTLDGIIYGYMDDTIAYNGINGQKAKILVNASEGKKFILLPLATTEKPYEVNSKVKVRVYKNIARILDEDIKW